MRDPEYTAYMLGMIARAEAKCDADLRAHREAAEAGLLIPSLAEQRRDLLIERGLARAAQAKYHRMMWGS